MEKSNTRQYNHDCTQRRSTTTCITTLIPLILSSIVSHTAWIKKPILNNLMVLE